MTNRILLLSDVIEQKIRKEKELAYYQDQLDELNSKMWWIQKEINITNLCIEVIQTEKANIVSGKLLGKSEDEH